MDIYKVFNEISPVEEDNESKWILRLDLNFLGNYKREFDRVCFSLPPKGTLNWPYELHQYEIDTNPSLFC